MCSNFEDNGLCATVLQEYGDKLKQKPPELFHRTEVDAAKVDSWSVGVTAFELFTGGFLTYENECHEPKLNSCHDLLKSPSMLNPHLFASAIDASWGPYEHLEFVQIMSGHFCLLYDLTDSEFVLDCWNFVTPLLQFDPKKRMCISQALNTTLMNTLHAHKPERKKFKCPL